ncbi:hypothetical protein PsorP6_006516 [Peronosclerospora sorghi]|uniref:Uncharacterized protein n=1 Tax=Peronosclerospora sorghi TaxID=230839 RepID=A0ACC0W231_9STRA|nr:hypothetical protein PsorP6_006516 [Peronosclerospora sorghi]
MLKTLLRHSFAFCGTKSSGTGATRVAQEVGAQVIQQKFEALVVVLGAVEDEKVLTAGLECFKWLVMFAVDALAAYTIATGANGIDTTLSVSAKLLSHAVSDASATCVGGLIPEILLKLGPSPPTPTVQGILIVVHGLCSSRALAWTLSVERAGAAAVGQFQEAPNMLTFVFLTWMEKQQYFYGLYCLKVTMSALLKVVEWKDPRIHSILVTGIALESSSAEVPGVQTTSPRVARHNLEGSTF